MNRKGLTSENIIVVIVAVIVVIGILLFIFKPQLIDWVKVLPKYGNSDEVKNASDIEKKVLTESECEVKVAELGGENLRSDFYNIVRFKWFNPEDARQVFIYEGEIKQETRLYFVVEDVNNMDLRILRGKKVGRLENGIVRINDGSYEDSEITSHVSALLLKRLNGAKQLESSLILCKSQDELDVEADGGENGIEAMIQRGYSNLFTLVFNDPGFLAGSDSVLLRWNFDRKSVMMSIRPDDEIIRDVLGVERVVFSSDDEIFELEVVEKIHPDDLLLVKDILGSESEEVLTFNINKIIDDKRASFENDGNYDMSLKQINNIIFGVDKLSGGRDE
jgi:hypothetical protein